jgi:mRNA interferase MazF
LRLDRGAQGHEQRSRRFGVVVQATDLAPLSTTVVAPTSTSARRASFRAEVRVKGRRTLVLCDQVRALDSRRLGKPVGRLSPEEMASVDSALRTALGLP